MLQFLQLIPIVIYEAYLGIVPVIVGLASFSALLFGALAKYEKAVSIYLIFGPLYLVLEGIFIIITARNITILAPLLVNCQGIYLSDDMDCEAYKIFIVVTYYIVYATFAVIFIYLWLCALNFNQELRGAGINPV